MSTLRKAVRFILTRRVSKNTRVAGYETVCLRAHLIGVGF